MGKIAKKSLYKNIISKGGGGPLAPAGGPWAPAREGEAYIAPAGGGGGGKVMRSPGKKFCYMLGIFITFLYVGAFLQRFSLRWGSQGTDARTNVRGGGGGKPKKAHHKNIKRPPPTQ